MSYCSDLTKERIMECAKAEFLKKGFQRNRIGQTDLTRFATGYSG